MSETYIHPDYAPLIGEAIQNNNARDLTTPGLQPLDLGGVLNAWLIRRNGVKEIERKKTHGSKRKGYYASEIGYPARKVFLGFIPEVPKKELFHGKHARVFENGEYVQMRHSDWLKEAGLLVAEEVRVDTYEDPEVPVNISGRIDLIIDYYKLYCLYLELAEQGFINPAQFPLPEGPAPKPGDLAIIEMKSVGEWGFKDHVKNDAPEPAHIRQLAFYQWRTGIRVGWVYYEDKNKQYDKAFAQVYDPRFIYGIKANDGVNWIQKGMLQELVELAEMIDRRELPPMCEGANASKFPCKWTDGNCGYYHFCWESDGVLPPPAKPNVVEIGGLTYTLPEDTPEEQIAQFKQLMALALVEKSETPVLTAMELQAAEAIPPTRVPAETKPKRTRKATGAEKIMTDLGL
jgi:hypothetical protein